MRQLEYRRHGDFETLDAPMWNSHTMTQAGRSQTFARKQAVSDQRTTQAVNIFKQQAGLFKRPLFAGDIDLRKHLCDGKNGGESVDHYLLNYARKPSRAQKSRTTERAAWLAGWTAALHQSFGRIVMMTLYAILVAHHLTIKLVHQFIHGSVQVFMGTLGKHVNALDVNIALRSLSYIFFLLRFHGEQHFDIDNLVKMTCDPINLGRNVTT